MVLATVGCASTGPGSGDDPPNIEIVAGGSVSDTVDTEPVQAVIVRVAGAAPGTVVRFESRAPTGAPFVAVSSLDGRSYSDLLVGSADELGRTAARVRLGTVAGLARLHIVVPEYGLIDSVAFQVEPGQIARVQGTPSDTTLIPGDSFTLAGTSVDRYNNPRNDAATLTSLDPHVVSVTGTTVRAEAVGRGRIQIRVGSSAAQLPVMVVPDGILSAITPTDVVVFRTDGTIVRRLAPVDHGTALTADWSPDGSQMVWDQVWGGGLRLLDADGTVRALTSPFFDLYPVFSADGAWIYYTRTGPWTIRRVRPDGSDDMVVFQPGHEAVAPAPSPDLSTIAYVIPGPDQVFLRDVAQGTSRLLASGHTPAWSPSGDQIAYVVPSTGELRLIRPNGTGSRSVGAQGQAYLGLDWSPDGEWLVFIGGSGEIALVNVTTGLTLPLAFTLGWSAPAWQR